MADILYKGLLVYRRINDGKKRGMGRMKKNLLYRICSVFLAAAMVLTCVPQTGLYAFAEEAASQEEEGQTDARTSPVSLDDDDQPEPGVDDNQNDTDQPGENQHNSNQNGGEQSGDEGEPGQNQEDNEPVNADSEVPTEEGVAPLADGNEEDPDEEEPEEEKQEFTVDFSSIKVNSKTYDKGKHSISGFPLWSVREMALNLTFKVTGTTKENTAYEQTGTISLEYDSVTTTSRFADVYEEFAPTECGEYTLELSVPVDSIDDTQYNFSEDSLQKSFHFYILPLQKEETKITGISEDRVVNGKTYLADKVYDGTPYNLSRHIGNAKVKAFPKDYETDSGIDITDVAEPLEFYVKKKIPDSDNEYDDGVRIDRDDLTNVPVDVGEYALYVKLLPNSKKNYVANEATYYFNIKKQALTITVNDQEMYVGDAPLTADEPLPEDRFIEQYQIEGLLDADRDAFMEELKIVPTQNIVADKTGIYEHVLVVSGIDMDDWSNYDFAEWNSATLTVKGQLYGVKSDLRAVTNVPNGTSLEEIAKTYLPKKATIYLYRGGKKPETSGGAGNTGGSGSSETPDPTEPDIVVDSAEIMWNTRGTSYNVATKTAQTFKMQGTVILPDLVYADDDTSLTVTVSVSVREAYNGQAIMPNADTPTGTVGVGTRVRLYTEEEGAQIWYTLDASDPSTSKTSRLYTGLIEITNTMTVKAIARVPGKRDSEVLRRVYYYNKKLNAGSEDDPDEPEVPDEDIPRDENGNKLPIPDDLWVTDVEQYIYTGKAIKPEVRVYDHKKRLEEKKDYTISYKNNVNAADKDNPSKAPTITIKGKGNYEGTLLKTFTISPKNIADADVKADALSVAFNNKAQKPVLTVTWNGKKLANNKDYSFDAAPKTEAGNYLLTITGIGNYTGEKKEIPFSITKGVPVSKLTVSKIPAYTYTGEKIEPEITVKNGKDVLSKGKDYTLSYEDNVEVGTASIIITGAEKSRFDGVKRVTFSIKEAALMNKAKIAMQFASGTMYTGKEITASAYDVTVDLKVNGVTQTRKLEKDKDYKVTYQNNVKAGTATVVFEGINSYRGTQKKTFKITAYDVLLNPNNKLSIQAAESYPYMKGGSTQKPVVKFDGKTLTEGTDYTLSYKSHTAAGSYATMTIKGKGNFTGSAVKGYLVEVQNLSKMTVAPADKVYQAKANIYKTTVRVYDTNGKQLSAGKDYDKNFTYTYSVIPGDMKIATADGKERKVGDEVAATDIIPYGTKIKVTVNAAGSNYTGTAEGFYSITRADIAKAKVTVPQQTYTGKPIELKEKDISVLMNGMPVSSDEYKIISYTNNVNKGTAKLTIQGQGNYGGTKTVTFKIKGKSLFKLF